MSTLLIFQIMPSAVLLFHRMTILNGPTTNWSDLSATSTDHRCKKTASFCSGQHRASHKNTIAIALVNFRKTSPQNGSYRNRLNFTNGHIINIISARELCYFRSCYLMNQVSIGSYNECDSYTWNVRIKHMQESYKGASNNDEQNFNTTSLWNLWKA